MRRLVILFLALSVATWCGVAGATSSPVLTDAQAANAVVPVSGSPESHPENYLPNHTVPTSSQLASFLAAPMNFAGGPPPADFAGVTGNYRGSTDAIIQWATAKWGLTAYLNAIRAEGVAESGQNAHQLGDIEFTAGQCAAGDWNGWVSTYGFCWNSYGLMQVRRTSFNTSPMDWSSTAFNVDFRLAYLKACMAGDIGYMAGATSPGYPTYPNGTTDQMFWGCMGDWYSGGWYDSGAVAYIATVQSDETSARLTQFAVTSPIMGSTVTGTITVTTQPPNDASYCYLCLTLNGQPTYNGGVENTCQGGSNPSWQVDTTGAAHQIDGVASLAVDSYDCNNVWHAHTGSEVQIAN